MRKMHLLMGTIMCLRRLLHPMRLMSLMDIMCLMMSNAFVAYDA